MKNLFGVGNDCILTEISLYFGGVIIRDIRICVLDLSSYELIFTGFNPKPSIQFREGDISNCIF